MTAPVLDVQQHADALSDRLRDLTDATVADAAGVLRTRLDLAYRDIVALYVRAFGGVDRPAAPGPALARFTRQASARLAEALSPAAVDVDVIERAWLTAYDMGTDHALDTAPSVPLSLPTRDEADLPDLTVPVAEARAQAVSGLSQSVVAASGFPAVGVAVARARSAAARVEASAAFHITAAATAGVRDMAAQHGTAVLWVAERNGCLSCLAYSGETTRGEFRTGLSFDDRPLVPPGALLGPPLHPRCRCTLELFHERDQAVADSLKREAKRSVLRGWADPGESQPAKLRAASRLLDTAHGLPASVEKAARRAVRDGGFPDDPPARAPRRNVPAPPDPQPAAARRVEDYADDELDQAMQDAIVAEDYDLLDALGAEADRRDAEKRAAAGDPPPAVVEAFARPDDDGWAEAWGVVDDDPGDEVDPEEAHRLDTMAELIEQGMSEVDAYAAAYGVSQDRARRDEAIRQLRAAGYSGDGFDALARQSYRDYLNRAYAEAEDATNGYLLNRAAEGVNARAAVRGEAGIDPYSLFSGPLARAVKYASDELKAWWEENGRVTFDEHKASLLGQGAAARAAGSGRFVR